MENGNLVYSLNGLPTLRCIDADGQQVWHQKELEHHHSLNLKMEKTHLLRFFHQVISSHSIGFPKENKQFWNKLQGIETLSNEHTLLIDDSLSVLDAAKNHGIKHLLSIKNPDSKKAIRTITNYDSIADFTELIPVF